MHIERDPQMHHMGQLNTLCAMAIKTTGDDPRKCDIVEICVLPLDNYAEPSRKHIPFYNQIAPFRVENIDFSTATATKANIRQASMQGIEPSAAADYFEEWVRSIGTPEGKKIIPLCHNWPVMREYLITWLGYRNFQFLFSPYYRDVMAMAMFTNDNLLQCARRTKYAAYELYRICDAHAIEFSNKDDVMVRASKIAKLYSLMISIPPRRHSLPA